MSAQFPNVQRTLLACAPNPQLPPIPLSCERDKTIFLSNTGILYLFHDKRAESRQWVARVLPTLFPAIWTQDRFATFWDSYEGHNKWLEFDTGKKILTHCEIISQR